jgi:hypothetical protein
MTMFQDHLRRALHVVTAVALLPASVALAQDVKAAEAAFQQAANQATAALKADFATVVTELHASLQAELADAYSTAFAAATSAMFVRVGALDAAASALNADLSVADPSLGVPPGMAVGNGGAVDTYHRKLRAALAKLDKAFARELDKTLKKARKLLPEPARLTAVVFPLPQVRFADTGVDGTPSQSSFRPRAPLLLAGYADDIDLKAAGLSLADPDDELGMTLYDADGVFLVSVPATQTGSMHLATTDVPRGSQLPHGNLQVEMHADGSGWTACIGY